MKMKIWIEEAMKEMVEEVEKIEPKPQKNSNVIYVVLSVAFVVAVGASVAIILLLKKKKKKSQRKTTV